MVPAASAAQGKPISLYSLREQLPISCPKEKKFVKSNSSVCQIEYSFCSVTEESGEISIFLSVFNIQGFLQHCQELLSRLLFLSSQGV